MMNATNFVLLRSPLQSLNRAFDELALLSDNIFDSAVELAAPDLYKELEKIASASEKEKQKLYESLRKYWIRSCTRCTPYGMFAGTAILNLTEKATSIILETANNHTLRTRLDMNYLYLLKNTIEKKGEIKAQLRYSANNSLYETNDDYRYTEYVLRDNVRNYRLSSVEKSAYLSFVLSACNLPSTFETVSKKFVIEFPNFSLEEVEAYLSDLEESQILINNLEPNLTGKDPFSSFIEELESFHNVEDLTANLKDIFLKLSSVHQFDRIDDIILSLRDVVLVDKMPKDLLQIDLSLTTHSNVISEEIINNIVTECNQVSVLSRPIKKIELDTFIDSFLQRYDSQEIPLNIALDTDLGIGYGTVDQTCHNHWIDDLPVNNGLQFRHSGNDQLTDFVLSKYNQFLRNGDRVIVVTDEDLLTQIKGTQTFNFPPSMYIVGALLKKPRSDQGSDYLFDVNSISGPSAANLIGRFTLGDPKLTILLRELLHNEQGMYLDCILAEIVHQPQERSGNVLLRSILRDYEIPYLGKSGLDEAHQIPVNDLMVSIRNREIILRSIKHNKRILPRLSTAHNFNHPQNLPTYRFLCDLQSHGFDSVVLWDWGALKDVKYLPRVAYKSLILKKARWILDIRDISILKEMRFDGNSRNDNFILKDLPDRVVLVESDNRLFLDLRKPELLKILIAQISKHKSVIVEEFLFDDDSCFVKDVDNSPYVNEIVIPIFNNNSIKLNKKLEKRLNCNTIQRNFSPGDEWLYFKIYGGAKTLERLLLNTIIPFIKNPSYPSKFKKFFFVRFSDKLGTHLRLRFYNCDIDVQCQLQRSFMECLRPWIIGNLIHSVTIDTYVRELERYNDDMIIDCETIFFNDSIAVLGLNALLKEVEEANKYRLLLALRGIDIFLNEFQLNISDKLVLIKKLAIGFFTEFGSNSELKRSLNQKYRDLQKEIFSHMDVSCDDINGIGEAISIFITRAESNKFVVSNILNRCQINLNISTLLSDFIHLHVNRLFIAKQRKYELLIYTFLERYYSSIVAISKKNIE